MLELKMPEILATKLNYGERIAKKMEKLYQKHTKVQPFDGCFVIETIFFLYLFKKYKMNCIIGNNGHDPSIGLVMHYDEINPTTYRPIYKVAKRMFPCIVRGDPIIIIPLTFTVSYIKEPTDGHANILIYRRNTGHLEHFEPHGSIYGGEDFVIQYINYTLNKLVELLNEHIDHHNITHTQSIQRIVLIKASNVCIDLGVQAIEERSIIPKNALIEPDGYCSAWSMFFTELCLKNPEIPSKQINDAILFKARLYDTRDYLRNVIKGYTCFINNKIAKHFSYIFDEPVSSAKIHTFDDPKVEIISFMKKLQDIMDTETGENNTVINITKDRYAEFAQTIHSDTSSSSLKEEERISPARKLPMILLKGSSDSPSNGESWPSPPNSSKMGVRIKNTKKYKRTKRTKLTKRKISGVKPKQKKAEKPT
jgi:hypothetical protein